MCAPILSTVLREKCLERWTKGKLWGQQDTIPATCSIIPSNLFPVFNAMGGSQSSVHAMAVRSRCTTPPAQLLANLKSLKASYTIGKLCFCCPPESIYLVVSKTFIGLHHVSALRGPFRCGKKPNDVARIPRGRYINTQQEREQTQGLLCCTCRFPSRAG